MFLNMQHKLDVTDFKRTQHDKNSLQKNPVFKDAVFAKKKAGLKIIVFIQISIEKTAFIRKTLYLLKI